jgi:hypothetical protein
LSGLAGTPPRIASGNFGQEDIVVKSIKTRIAAGATILGLGGLTGLALSAGHQKASQPLAAKPLVRTKVVHRTVHVTKHAKPKNPPAGGAAPQGVSGYAAPEAAVATTGSSSAGSSSYSPESAPVTSTSGSSSAPSGSSSPVVTHTSGSSAGSEGSSHPVVTHTSGASAGSGSGGSAPVSTGASGGGGAGGGGESDHEGGDGGGD